MTAKATFYRHGTLPLKLTRPTFYVVVIQFKARGRAWNDPASFRMALPCTLARSVEEAGALFEIAGAFRLIPDAMQRDYKITAAFENARNWIRKERTLTAQQEKSNVP